MTAQPAGSESGSTAKPWFWLVIATLPVAQVAHRLVAAVVAELELEGPAAQGEAEELVAEADAEDRHVGVDQLADVVDDLGQRLRIARAVREHHAVDRQGQAPPRPACGPAAPSAARRAPASERRMLVLTPKS